MSPLCLTSGPVASRVAACRRRFATAGSRTALGSIRSQRKGIVSTRGVLTAGLFGIVVGYVGIGSQWYRRLVELGIDDKEGSLSILEYLGKNQVSEVVESNNLAREFCWITRLLAE
jgi:hypothetical protein